MIAMTSSTFTIPSEEILKYKDTVVGKYIVKILWGIITIERHEIKRVKRTKSEIKELQSQYARMSLI